MVGLLRGIARFESRGSILIVGVASILTACLDALALLLLYPIIALAAGPPDEALPQSARWLFDVLPSNVSITTLGLAFVLAIALKNLALTGTAYAQNALCARAATAATVYLARGYLALPITAHDTLRTAHYMRSIRDLPRAVMCNGVLSVFGLLSEAAAGGLMVLLLVIIEPLGMATAVTVFAVLLGLNHRTAGRFFRRWASESATYRRQLDSSIASTFPNMRVIIGARAEPTVAKQIAAASAGAIRIERNRRFTQSVIRPLSEISMVLAGTAVIAVTLEDGRPPEAVLPFLATLAFGAFRLLPSLNRVALFSNEIRGAQVDLSDFNRDIETVRQGRQSARVDSQPIESQLRLESVSYSYPADGSQALQAVTLTLEACTFVGIAGPSGSGKSTLVDLASGLVEPTTGQVFLDGCDVTGCGPIGGLAFLPQDGLLIDGSIRDNVVFGSDAPVDDEQIWSALEMAMLGTFVAGLPNGIHTHVGERGANISGGESQRLALARAFFMNPSFLILDEAVTGLDTPTKDAVLARLRALSQRSTVVVVTHDSRVLAHCDIVHILEDGTLSISGSYSELIAAGFDFAGLAPSD